MLATLICYTTSDSTLKWSSSTMKVHHQRCFNHGYLGVKQMNPLTLKEGNGTIQTVQDTKSLSTEGKVTNSMDYAAATVWVAVVGLQKFALDISMECSTSNGMDIPVPSYTELSNGTSLITSHGEFPSHISPLIASQSYQFTSLVKGLCLVFQQHCFLLWVEKGSIRLKKAPSFSFCKEGILIDGETETRKTDLGILATGFNGVRKLRDIFASPTFQDLIARLPDKTVPLYRECVHPQIPLLAVIGFLESIANLYTSEIRCRWLAELDGTFELPSIKKMEKDITEWDEYMKRYSDKNYWRSYIGALHIWYNDQLCKDMGYVTWT